MPRLANDRNELYCRHRAKGMNAAKAALAAGYAPGSSTTHLEQDKEIVERIAELFEEQQANREAQRAAAIEAAKVVGQMTGVSRAWVITKLAENAQNAAADGQFKESNAALELIGRDFGMFTGGSGDESASNVPKSFDMDKLDALTEGALNALPSHINTAAEEARNFSPETALELISGHAKKHPKLADDRRLTTGSETDVALGADTPDVAEVPSHDQIMALEPISSDDFS